MPSQGILSFSSIRVQRRHSSVLKGKRESESTSKRRKKPSQRRLGFERKPRNRESLEEESDIEIDTGEIKAKTRQNALTKQKEGVSPDVEASAADNKLVSFTTDDFKIKRMVSSTTDLPLNKYTSLGAIFQNKTMSKTLSEFSYPVLKTPKVLLSRQHILGPLTPGKPEEAEKDDFQSAMNASKVPPDQFMEGERPDEMRLGKPPIGEDMWDPTKSPHEGIMWPMAWAPRPPYTTPGYQRKGVKQPVGVIQVERVPVAQSKGNTDVGEEDLPTWVSPLYRTYGIGGPYGPFGPFYEPPHIDDVDTTVIKVAIEPPAPPKKCLLMRLWEGFRKKNIMTKDKSLGLFLQLLDEKLVAIRELIHTVRKDEREMMSDVLHSLATVLDDAKDFENKLEMKEERLVSYEEEYDGEAAAETAVSFEVPPENKNTNVA